MKETSNAIAAPAPPPPPAAAVTNERIRTSFRVKLLRNFPKKNVSTGNSSESYAERLFLSSDHRLGARGGRREGGRI